MNNDNSYISECTHPQCYMCADRIDHYCKYCGARIHDTHLIKRIMTPEKYKSMVRTFRYLKLSWNSISEILHEKYKYIYKQNLDTGKLQLLFNM